MNNLVGKINTWMFFLIVILLLPVIIYGCFFYKLNFSNNPNDWTLFANFFAGLLNPIFLLINIVVLIKLTYEVAEYNKKNILSQMKYSAFNLISSKLYSLARIIISSTEMRKEIQLLRNEIKYFCTSNKVLFKDINLINYENKFDSILKKWEEEGSNSHIFNDFDDIRNEFIREIQNSIIN